ncbi:hypothetical protein [Chlorogloeopsis sp. ULAP02]|uniref:hypothetical protein n=1 Tax=Chlorogloeopsis sp. ULAP02 TaxID=3107926 RepID=UPI003136C2B4
MCLSTARTAVWESLDLGLGIGDWEEEDKVTRGGGGKEKGFPVVSPRQSPQVGKPAHGAGSSPPPPPRLASP